METFMIVFAMVGMTVGGLGFLASIGLLIWALWQRWYVEPSRRAANAATTSEGQSGVVAQ